MRVLVFIVVLINSILFSGKKSETFLRTFSRIFFTLVQCRSLINSKIDQDSSEKYFMEPIDHENLLAFLKHRQVYPKKFIEEYQNLNNDDNPVLSSNRHFSPTNNHPTHQKGRLSNNYGQKSHWDTFFGRK